MSLDGKEAEESSEIAELFAQYFGSMYSQTIKNDMEEDVIQAYHESNMTRDSSQDSSDCSPTQRLIISWNKLSEDTRREILSSGSSDKLKEEILEFF